MLKWLKEVLKKFTGSKFGKFLKEVFEGATGEVTNVSYEIVNEVVKNVENIGEYIVDTPEEKMSESELATLLTIKYGYDIRPSDVMNIDEDKGTGKYMLAYRLITERLKEEGKKEMLKYARQGINLAIEFAVNRYFGKVIK